MEFKSKTTSKACHVLIIGATGFIGKFIAEACTDAGFATFVLVQPAAGNNPSKASAIELLQDKGAVVLHGDMGNKSLMVKVLKEHEIDVVICTVGGKPLMDQLPLIEAIKSVGTIKRFLPSEFGHDVDRSEPVEPGLKMYIEKRRIRRLIEEYDIPYTYICCNSIASWPYYDKTHPSEFHPPLDEIQIYGDGNVKAYFVAGTDIGKYTMKVIADVRTANKIVHFRPSCNFYNMNELASLWEKKIGRTLPRVTVTEEDLLIVAAENRIPQSIVASLTHDIFINGCQVSYSVDGPRDVEVSDLYPDDCFKTLDEFFDSFVVKVNRKVAETPSPHLVD